MTQVSQSPSWTMPVLAFCLSLIFSIALAPTLGLVAYHQYDFWLMWLVSMLLLALPFTILEIGLAKRSKSTPLNGFMQLTRDADRSTHWRLLTWASVIFIPFIAGGILAYAAQNVQQQLSTAIAANYILILFAIVAVALSLVPRMILLIVALLSTLAVAIIGLINIKTTQWHWTPITLVEWSQVVTLVLVTGGLGLGLYWQLALQQAKTQSKSLPIILPIWFAQVVGLGLLAFIDQPQTLILSAIYTLAALALAAVFLQCIREQLLDRKVSVLIQAVIILVPVLIWAVPEINHYFYGIIIVLGLSLCLAYAIFVGWLMKISHLRKAINFDHEVIYNLWRIAIRLIVPLSIIVAIFGWLITVSGV